ncbi:GNAT family N-acetyltransferase [Pendulispora brunnea]|uniref:GNAT family N-acetyltransferase n=1 Tax=Pendulispora brunnea TaxID=2905690 RepID=A0ABZ2K2M1_9BACT
MTTIAEDAVTLRPAIPSDANTVARIWYEGWRDGHLGNVPDALVVARTEASFYERAAERVGDTVVAVVEGEVVGFVMVVDDEVEQVYLSNHRRGSGIAGFLLGEAERLVAANGHERAWLAVAPGNGRARKFYERQGWVDDGLFEYMAGGAAEPIPVPCQRYVKRVGGGVR